MELRNLITFLKIVETGSFSKAAEQLLYSQSTVTVQIQQLEDELQVQLFDRIGKKVFVTEKGRELEAYAQQMIELSQKIAAIGGEEQELQGTLRIASVDSLITAVLPAILKEFYERYPKVHVIVKTADNILNAERLVSQNEADLAFIAYDKRNTKSFSRMILQEARFVFAAAPTHPLAARKNISLDEIAQNDVIVMNQQFSFSELSNEHTKILGHIIKPAFDIWNPMGAMELAKRGCGVTLLPYYLIEDYIKRNDLCVLDVPELTFNVWIQTLHHENKFCTPQMNAFFKLLKDYYHL